MKFSSPIFQSDLQKKGFFLNFNSQSDFSKNAFQMIFNSHASVTPIFEPFFYLHLFCERYQVSIGFTFEYYRF